ncbi:MAG TPA: FtsX-like permease family protein [Mycobacteriales bacterium]|nr:FtsX-like permease family protein [Mycobacteriales bacterium]
MTVLWTWLRLELRRRRRSLAVLALLIAFATATVLTAVAGAHRGDTAVERLRAQTLPADAVVLPNQPGFDWDKIRTLPEVTALSTFPVTEVPVEGIPAESLAFPPDDQLTRSIERPVILHGRMFDRSRVDEVMVSANFVRTYHKGVGDTVTLHLDTVRQVNAARASGDDAAKPAGPRITARIVGIARSPFYADEVGGKGGLLPSPAVLARYRANVLGTNETAPDGEFINALIRLKGGEAALPAFRADLARVSGRTDIDVWNQADVARHLQKVDSFEGSCLLAFGIAALVAAILLVGQSIARYTAANVVDLQILRAVGMTPRQTLIAASIGPFLAAATGATLGVAGAAVASRWMPIGAASTSEPAPGVDLDWTVLGTGWAVVPLLVVAGAATSAWLALAASRARTSPRRSGVAVAAARLGLPVPVVVGARFALEPGRGRSAVPVRPALLGAVVGVLGVLAAFTFSAGVSDAVRHPTRFGQTFQLESYFGFNGMNFGAHGTDPGPVPQVVKSLARDRDVSAVNDARIAVAESGNASVTIYSYSPVGAAFPVVLTDGRMPHAADEVVLGPTSAHNVGAHVGSTVTLSGNRGAHPVRVTGIGFVPEGPHNGYDDGGWLTTAGYDRLFTGFKYHIGELALRPGSDPAAVVSRLQRAAGAYTGGAPIDLEPPQRPSEIAEIQDVRVLPIVLGGFLLLLAVGAVGHALATAVRRRRHDMAVLRALGMTRWQSRAVVITQASILALVGLAFGVPIGIALARTLWRQVANNTPLLYHPPLAVWALLLVAPLALLIANLLAAWPGQRAARLQVGQTLRAE